MAAQPIIDTRLEDILRAQQDDRELLGKINIRLLTQLADAHSDLRARTIILEDHLTRIEMAAAGHHAALLNEISSLVRQLATSERLLLAETRLTHVSINATIDSLRANLWSAFWHSFALACRRQWHRLKRSVWPER